MSIKTLRKKKYNFSVQKYSNQVWRFVLFSVNVGFPHAFHFKSFQSTKRRSDSRTSVPWNFISRRIAQRQFERFCVRQSLPKSTRERVARFERSFAHGALMRRAPGRKRNSVGSWHVSRLSVFTEIPCTLRPITFVTDYSTKVSHRARGRKLTPDKLHRANRQCSQMEPEARRLFKQRASQVCGSHDHIQSSTPVILNSASLEDLIETRYTHEEADSAILK
jgi:hypothetical protein